MNIVDGRVPYDFLQVVIYVYLRIRMASSRKVLIWNLNLSLKTTFLLEKVPANFLNIQMCHTNEPKHSLLHLILAIE